MGRPKLEQNFEAKMCKTFLLLLLYIVYFSSCQRGSSVSRDERLRLCLSEVLRLSRQKITNETRTSLRPRRRIGQRFSQSVIRANANNPDFDVLKQAREGVWYRKLEEGEGVNLIRVKGDEDILNRHPVTQEGIKIKRN